MITTEFVQHCISEAEACRSKLPDSILSINGKCGLSVKHFLNLICSRPDVRHFDFGTGTGASIMAASFGNTGGVLYTVDNFKQGAHNKPHFTRNHSLFNTICHYTFLETDVFELDFSKLVTCDSLFWDGLHSTDGTRDSITYCDPLFDTRFLMVLDDWNYSATRDGWLQVMNKMRYRVLYERIIPTDFYDVLINDFHSTSTFDTAMAIIDNNPNKQKFPWWNGVYIGLLEKRKMFL